MGFTAPLPERSLFDAWHIWGFGKNYEVPDSFFQEDFESIFFQQSAFSYSSEYVISWCLYLYLSQTPFFYSIGVYRLL